MVSARGCTITPLPSSKALVAPVAFVVICSSKEGLSGVGASSSPRGAEKRGVTPCCVGRKKGALGSGFSGSVSLFRSFTSSRCNVASTLLGATSESVSSSSESGVVVEGAATAGSGASKGSGSSGSGAPGSSTWMGVVGSGRSSGADKEGSKRNLRFGSQRRLRIAIFVHL